MPSRTATVPLVQSPLAAWAFDKYRTPENIRSILQQVYRNQEAVDDALVELLYRPSCDPGALGVFVSVITGPPGPRPWDMAAKVQAPILALWGDILALWGDILCPLAVAAGNSRGERV